MLTYSRLYYNYLVNSIIVSAFIVLLSKFCLNYPEAYLLKSIAIEVSLSLSAILFQMSIAIAIGDTFTASIAIDYRRYFRKVSLTALHNGFALHINFIFHERRIGESSTKTAVFRCFCITSPINLTIRMSTCTS